MFEFVKKIFFDGVQLMIPLFLVIFVIQKIFEIIYAFLKPIIATLPSSPFFGEQFSGLRALIVFIVLIFLCGIMVRIGLGKYIMGWINSIVIKIVPGHSVFESMISEEAETKVKEYKSVVLAQNDEAWSLGLVIEEKNEEGFIMIYIPSAPIPSGGNLFLMKEDQIRRVNISVHEALKCIWHLGKDSDKLLKGKVKW